MWRVSPGVVCAYPRVGHVTACHRGASGVVLLAGVSGGVCRSPQHFSRPQCATYLVSFCLPTSAHCIVARMRDFMLCATCARRSIGALGVGGGSISIRARQGGGTVGEGFVRGEYAQERQ